jgi:hypothetical protein
MGWHGLASEIPPFLKSLTRVFLRVRDPYHHSQCGAHDVGKPYSSFATVAPIAVDAFDFQPRSVRSVSSVVRVVSAFPMSAMSRDDGDLGD